MNGRPVAILAQCVLAAAVAVAGVDVHHAKFFSEINLNHLTDANRATFIADAKAAAVDQIELAVLDFYETGAAREAKLVRLREEIRAFEEAGFGVTVWFDTLGYGYALPDGKGKRLEPLAKLTSFAGKTCWALCPADPAVRALLCGMARDFARAGAKALLVDDDFIQSVRPGLGCVCRHHLARVAKRIGRTVTAGEIRQAFTGAPNALRTAFLDTEGAVALETARAMRAAVDEVDPRIVLGLAASYTHYDVEGCDIRELVQAFAGPGRRGFFRISGAPYWSTNDRIYRGAGLESVFNFVRMQSALLRNADMTLFDENDPYPRKAAVCPPWKTELYDKVMLADGVLRRHKYLLCYGADRAEPGYLDAHLANLPDDPKLVRMFAGKEDAGLNVFHPEHCLREATLPASYAGDYTLMARFSHPIGADVLTREGFPTRFGGGGALFVFGSAAEKLDPRATKGGAVLDRAAARILAARGVKTDGAKTAVLDFDANAVDFNPYETGARRAAILAAYRRAAGTDPEIRFETPAGCRTRFYPLVKRDPKTHRYAALIANLGDGPLDIRFVTARVPVIAETLRGAFGTDGGQLRLTGLAPHAYAAVTFDLPERSAASATPGGAGGPLANCAFSPYGEFVSETPSAVATGCPDFEVELPRRGGPTVRAADFGFAESGDDNGAALDRALAECRRVGASRLELAPGFYNCFGPKGVEVGSFSDLEIDGRGAVLIFRRPPRTGENARQFDIPVAGANIVFSNCLRVAAHDFSLDWDWDREPLADFATIAAVHVDDAPDASYVDFRLCDHVRHPQYPNPVPIQTIGGMTSDHGDRRPGAPFSGFYGTSEGHFGAKNAWIAPNVLRVWPNVKLAGRRYQPLYDARFSPALNRKSAAAAAKDAGGTYRIAHCYYGPNAINTYGCRHLTFRRVDIWSAYGMGIRTSGPQRYWQVIDCHVRPPPADLRRADGRPYAPYRRGVTATADAHHVVQSRGFVKFVGCSWTLHQDDSHNFHDRSTLATTVGARRLEVVNGRGAEYFGAAVGDEIELVQEDFSRTGWKGRIAAIDGDTYAFDRPLPAQKGLCFVLFNASYGTDNILLRDCEFANTLWARSLVHGANVTVENCRFRNITGAPLRFQIEYTWNAWCEGFGCTNVAVRGCTFENDFDGYGAEGLHTEIYAGARLSPPVEQWIRIGNRHVAEGLAARRAAHDPGPAPSRDIVSGLLVEKCRFLNPRGLVFQAMSGRDLVIRDCDVVFDRPAYPLLPYAGSVYLRNADRVTVKDIRVAGGAGAQPGVYRSLEKEK